MICSVRFRPWAGWVATEINNVEGCPPPEVDDDEDEEATTEAVEEEGIDEGPPDDEPGCKSPAIIPPKFIK